MILENIRFLVTQNEEREIKENVDLRIKDGEVERIANSIEADEKSIDCSDRIVLPGLINCHTHVSMSLLRGVSDDKTLEEWLHEDMMPREAEFTPEDVYRGAILGIKEMLKTGTTCFNDMYAPERQVADAVQETGIRAVLANGLVERENVEEDIRESREFVEYVKDIDRIEPAVSPHAVYTVSEPVLKKLNDQAKEHDAILHIHLSETVDENQDFEDENGERPAEFLERIGLLHENTVAAHCTHLEEEEIEILAKNDVSVAHNPCANLKLGSGMADTPEMLEKDVNVGLGTDGPASNNSFNIFEEMKFASLIQKNENPRDMTAQQTLDLATVNAAKALGLEDVGSIEEGMKADLVAVKTDQTMKPLEKRRIVSHIVFSSPEVSETFVDGELLVRNGTLEDSEGI